MINLSNNRFVENFIYKNKTVDENKINGKQMIKLKIKFDENK